MAKNISQFFGSGSFFYQNSGATNSTGLNYYEEYSDTSTSNWKYAGLPFNHQVNWVRIGKIASWSWNIFTDVTVNNSYYSYYVPARFRPAQQYLHGAIRVENNSTQGLIGFWIYDVGSTSIQIYTSFSQQDFTGAGGTCGFSEYSGTWCMN